MWLCLCLFLCTICAALPMSTVASAGDKLSAGDSNSDSASVSTNETTNETTNEVTAFDPARANALSPLPAALHAAHYPPAVAAQSWLLADFHTGWILGAHNADERIAPASLTKLMTAYVIFKALADGEIKISDRVRISKNAHQSIGSKMFVRLNSRVAVDDLLHGMIIQSGNDAAVALAEYLSGDEKQFAARMNATAKQLGLVNTNFTNSSGLPANNHYSTARDMSILTRALIRNFPQRYTLYSEREYTYDNITQKNRNRLLWRDGGVDGIKTGYTESAGYCLIASANRNGARLIATIVGAVGETERADEAQALLDYGFENYHGKALYQRGDEVLRVRLWMGREATAGLIVDEDVGWIAPLAAGGAPIGKVTLDKSVAAPLSAFEPIGALDVQFNGKVVRSYPLYVDQDYPPADLLPRAWDWLARLFAN